MTVIVDSVVDEVAARCGMAASGLYLLLERRVGKDGSWTCTMGFLAQSFGQTERHIRSAAETLEKAGFLTRTPVTGPNGMTTGIRWYLPKHPSTYRAEPTPVVTPEPTPELSCALNKESSSHVVVTSNPPTEERAPKSPAKPLPENGVAQQIVKAYCLVARLEAPANYKKAVGQAAMLAKAGVTPEEIPDLYGYVAGWAKGADLGLMLNQVDRWRASRNHVAPARTEEDWNAGGRGRWVG